MLASADNDTVHPRRPGLVDLAIVVVSANDAHWLSRCLSSVLDHAGEATLDVVVVANGCTDGTRELVESDFPRARVVSAPNRGFSYGNNRGIERAQARYYLLLNPDTEIVSGDFDELIAMMDARPRVGLVGVRQVTADGTLWPTIRRFPSVTRALGEAMFSERWPIHPAWAGERVLDMARYEMEGECDWPLGAFMLARREALLSAGLLDERFFIYSEEPDLCRRIKQAGWSVRHLPRMTIVHHAGKGGIRPRNVAQETYARIQYARKWFGPVRRRLYLAAVGLRHVLRIAGASASGDRGAVRREASVAALRALLGRAEPPYGAPSVTAVDPLAATAEPFAAADQPAADPLVS